MRKTAHLADGETRPADDTPAANGAPGVASAAPDHEHPDSPDRRTPAPPPPVSDPHQPQADDEQQGLFPGLLAAIRNYRSVPPERAMFRELLSSAVGRTIETYVVGGLKIGASSIKLVAWSLFARMNSAGFLVDDEGRPFSRETFARDACLSKRVVRAAIGFLKQARVIAVDPTSGPNPELIRINIGGLDWSAVQHRIKILIADRDDPDSTANQQPLLLVASGEAASPLNGARGEAASPHERYVRGEQIKSKAAAEAPARAGGGDRRQAQQQPDDISPEGERLIDALAGRSREHDLPFAEGAVRRRLAEGELTNADLRRRLNTLPPRLATLTPEQWAADEAAGRVDRRRKGGYPAPPDDPRFTLDG